MARRDLRVDIIGNDRASGPLRDVGNEAERSSGKFAKLGAVGRVAGAGVAGVGIAALSVAPSIFQAAASMETLDAKAKTVFGDQLGTVDKWAKANAAAMGLTSKQAVGLSAGFADLLIPMGFTREAAAKMSTDVVGLSGALSQWSGGQKTAAEVSDILSAAMLGETDGLKSLGISIGAADIEARLLAQGQAKLTGAARQQAEAQAIQALIMEKSTDAQTAYKNSSGTLLGQQQKLTARVMEFKDKAIAALIPVLLRASSFVSGSLVPAFWRAVGAFDGVRTSLQRNRPQLAALGSALLSVARFAGQHVIPIMGRLAAFMAGRMVDNIGTAVRIVASLAQRFKDAYGWVRNFWNTLREVRVPKSIEAIGSIVGKIAGGLKGGAGAAGRFFGVGDGPGRAAAAGGGSTLRRVQSMLGPGLSVSSTYRTPAHNRRIGGSPTSYHMDRNNPAVDVVGSPSALDRLYATMQAVGGWRELLWRVPGHFDHLHVAHQGGVVSPSWGTLPGLRSDERPVITQVGETILPRGVRPMAAPAGGDVVIMLDGREIARAVNAVNGKRMTRGGTMPNMVGA